MDVQFHGHRVEPHFRSGPINSLKVVHLPTRSRRQVVLVTADVDVYCEQEAGRCLVYVNHATWPDYDVDVKVVAHGDYVKIAVPPKERFQCPTRDVARLSQQGLTQNEIEDVVFNEDAQSAYSPSMLSSDEMRALAVDRVVTDDESSNDVHSMLQTVRSSHDHECGTDQVCKEISRLHSKRATHHYSSLIWQ